MGSTAMPIMVEIYTTSSKFPITISLRETARKNKYVSHIRCQVTIFMNKKHFTM